MFISLLCGVRFSSVPKGEMGVRTPKFVKHSSQNLSKNVKKSQKGASPHCMSLQGVIIIIIKLFTLGEAK